MAREPLTSKYLHAKGKALGLPISGTLELTARCNFNCKMCYVHLTQQECSARGQELTAQQWLALAEEAKRAGTVFLLLTGGEPTLRPDFPEIYREIKKMGFVVSVNSNGYLLDGALRELFLEEPPARLNISLYGTSDETYLRLCGVPAYSRVMENIRALRLGGVSVRLNLSVTPENAHELRAVRAAAQSIGAHMQAAAYLFPPRRRGEAAMAQFSRLSPETAGSLMADFDALTLPTEALRERAAQLAQGRRPNGTEDCDGTVGNALQCRAGSTAFWLTWDGKLLPCGQMVEPAVDAAALGFAESWRQIREKTAALRLPAVCVECSMAAACHVCAAKCYCETGRFDGRPEYLCRMTASYYEAALAARDEICGGAK